MVVEFFFIFLRIEQVDAVTIEITESKPFFRSEFYAAEFLIAKIVDAGNKSGTFFIEQFR